MDALKTEASQPNPVRPPALTTAVHSSGGGSNLSLPRLDRHGEAYRVAVGRGRGFAEWPTRLRKTVARTALHLLAIKCK